MRKSCGVSSGVSSWITRSGRPSSSWTSGRTCSTTSTPTHLSSSTSAACSMQRQEWHPEAHGCSTARRRRDLQQQDRADEKERDHQELLGSRPGGHEAQHREDDVASPTSRDNPHQRDSSGGQHHLEGPQKVREVDWFHQGADASGHSPKRRGHHQRPTTPAKACWSKWGRWTSPTTFAPPWSQPRLKRRGMPRPRAVDKRQRGEEGPLEVAG